MNQELANALEIAHTERMAVLLFDVMDTLVWDPFRLLPGHFRLSFPELMQQKHPTAWTRFERGELDHAGFCREFFVDGRVVDDKALRELLCANYRYLPGIPQLLADLKRRGHELHAFSNYPEWYTWIEAKLLLSEFLSWSFVSCQTGYRKPDPRAYEHALQVLAPVEISELWFIDDRAQNVVAAERAGMHGVRFEDASQLRAALHSAGLV